MDKIKKYFNDISDNWTNESDDINLIRELIKASPIKKGDSVLDIGCGKGILTPYLYEVTKKKVIAIDIADKMIEGAKIKYNENSNYEFICDDFLVHDFNELFDALVVYNAYPHFLDVVAFNNKASKLLKNKGYLILMHSLGREKLNMHHHNVMEISRILEEPKKEFEYFKSDFALIKSLDMENCYLMVLEKNI